MDVSRISSRLESLESDGEEFATKFKALSEDVVTHAEAEEHEEFADLEGELTDEARTRVVVGVQLVADAMEGSLPGETFEEMFAGAKERLLQA